MSFASNWLEELIAEWLELDGYLVMMRPPVHIAGSRGGRFEPDVVGARIRGGTLQIRHCETTVSFANTPDYEAKRINKKFQLALQEQVCRRFCDQLGGHLQDNYDYDQNYEKWVVYCYASQPVRTRLQAIHGLTLKKLDDLIAEDVIESMARWGEDHQPNGGVQPSLPQDKWLLRLLDYLVARSDYEWGSRGNCRRVNAL